MFKLVLFYVNFYQDNLSAKYLLVPNVYNILIMFSLIAINTGPKSMFMCFLFSHSCFFFFLFTIHTYKKRNGLMLPQYAIVRSLKLDLSCVEPTFVPSNSYHKIPSIWINDLNSPQVKRKSKMICTVELIAQQLHFSRMINPSVIYH